MFTISLVYQEDYVPLAKIRKIRQGCLAKLEGVMLQTIGHWLFNAPCYRRGVLQLNIPFQRSGYSASSWPECGVAVSFFSHEMRPGRVEMGGLEQKTGSKLCLCPSLISIDVFFSGTRGNVGKSDREHLTSLVSRLARSPKLENMQLADTESKQGPEKNPPKTIASLLLQYLKPAHRRYQPPGSGTQNDCCSRQYDSINVKRGVPLTN